MYGPGNSEYVACRIEPIYRPIPSDLYHCLLDTFTLNSGLLLK
jgi:hypothetical protein